MPVVATTELVFRRAGDAGVNGANGAHGTNGFVLRVPPFALLPGQSLAVRGPSGSGKSTLLALLSGELAPAEGSVRVHFDGATHDLGALPEAARRAYRARRCGQVFQTFELVASLDALENVLLPFRLHGALQLDGAARARAQALFARVGLAGKERRSIHRLSHGERQRVAIARALVTQPSVILADEPTGNLDPRLKGEVAELLRAEAHAAGAALVVATHDESILPRFDSVLAIGGAA